VTAWAGLTVGKKKFYEFENYIKYVYFTMSIL